MPYPAFSMSYLDDRDERKVAELSSINRDFDRHKSDDKRRMESSLRHKPVQ